MTSTAIWLTEEQVASLVSLDDTIDALERGLGALGEGKAFNVPKALGGFDDGSSMHSLGSGLPDAGFVGYKNWVHTKRGAKAMYVLFDSHQGKLLAMMEANSLGQLRTAAMTGVGTRWMSPNGVSDMAVIGTGMQALAQVAAVNLVRPLKRIRVWSPTPEKRQAFAARLREKFDAEISVSDSCAAALEGAPLVTLVTRAKDPFVSASMLARGAHVNAVGAILPGNAELLPDVFGRVGLTAVDDVAGVKKASREFIDHFENDIKDWSSVRPLGELIARREQRPKDCDISLFKAMGMGVSDLSVAMMAYHRAKEQSIGQALPVSPGAAPLRWSKSDLQN
jgi:ornithine cyclodeaminase/alanine dehydrogenase-like protein (mu-crystallin family)